MNDNPPKPPADAPTPTSDTVTSFRSKDGNYTDFRVMLRDIVNNEKSTKRGIIVLINDKGNIDVSQIATAGELAFVGAFLLRYATDIGGYHTGGHNG